MTTLLSLHGLHAKPHHQKVDALARLGWRVLAPHIDYQQPGMWQRLMAELEREESQGGMLAWVVGSSMGGYVGEAIARSKGVPILSFNPALPYRTSIDPLLPPDLPPLTAPHHIVLGLQDDIIDAYATKGLVAELADWPYVLYEESEMGHRTPPEVFARYAERVIGMAR